MGRLEHLLSEGDSTEVKTLLDSKAKAGAAEDIFEGTSGEIGVTKENLQGKRSFAVTKLYLEVDQEVTQGAGGATANPDEFIKRITELKFDDFLRAVEYRRLVGVAGISVNFLAQFWKAYTGAGITRNFVPHQDGNVNASATGNIMYEIPLWEAHPGDPNPAAYAMDIRMLDKAIFKLAVVAAAAVNANTTMVDRWRLKAKGHYTDDIYIPPRVIYEYVEADGQDFRKFEVGGQHGTLLMLAMLDESGTFTDGFLRSTDYVTIENDNNVILDSNIKTIGELYRDGIRKEHIGLSPFAASGTINGIHNSYVDERNIWRIIDPGNRMSRRNHPMKHIKITKGDTYTSSQFRFLLARAIRHDLVYLNQVCQKIMNMDFPGGYWVDAEGGKEVVNLGKRKRALPILLNLPQKK